MRDEAYRAREAEQARLDGEREAAEAAERLRQADLARQRAAVQQDYDKMVHEGESAARVMQREINRLISEQEEAERAKADSEAMRQTGAPPAHSAGFPLVSDAGAATPPQRTVTRLHHVAQPGPHPGLQPGDPRLAAGSPVTVLRSAQVRDRAAVRGGAARDGKPGRGRR